MDSDGKVKAEGEFFFYDKFWKEIEKVGEVTLRKILEKREELGWHQFREYELDKARTNERITDFPEDGDCILVLYIDGSAEIKLNQATADAFDLTIIKRIRHHFEDLYLTNTAQSGLKLKLLIGKGDWQIEETYPQIDLTGSIRNDLLQQITNPDKIGQIIKNSHVIPHADILCEKILLSETTRLDQWRSSEDYTYMDPGRILLHSTTKLSDWRHPSDLTLIAGGQIYTHSIEADKLNIVRHIVTGAAWSDNSPSAGYIAWAGAKVTYNGSTYTIADGNTNKKYVWWDFSLSKTTFQVSNTQPTLTDDDLLVAYNNSGIHILVWNATLVDGRNIRTGTIHADAYYELRNTYMFNDQDSLDPSYPFEMDFKIVSEMTAIVSVKLSFRIRNFRAYATGVPSGGGHTTPAGGGHTTPAGGGHTTPSGGGATSGAKGTPSGGGATSGATGSASGGGSTSGSATHNHPGSTASETGASEHIHPIYISRCSVGQLDYAVGFDQTGPLYYEASAGGVREHSTYFPTDWGSHSHDLNIVDDGAHTHTTPDHTHPNHTHTTPNHTHPSHTHTTPSHQHTVSDHTHIVSNHTHTVSNHTHSLSFGIYEEVQSPTLNVYIDNGAGYGASIGTYTEDQLDIDISDHISGTGFKRIKFTSDKRTRISGMVECKIDLTA